MSRCLKCNRQFKSKEVHHLHRKACTDNLETQPTELLRSNEYLTDKQMTHQDIEVISNKTREVGGSVSRNEVIKMLDHLYQIVHDGQQRKFILQYKTRILDNSI